MNFHNAKVYDAGIKNCCTMLNAANFLPTVEKNFELFFFFPNFNSNFIETVCATFKQMYMQVFLYKPFLKHNSDPPFCR